MKKVLALSIVLLVLLTGCYDHSTEVSNKNEVLVSVGNNKVTRQELYEMMKEYDAGAVLSSKIDSIIIKLEVETTDEMEAEVEEQIAELQEAGTLETTLENYGMSEEEYRDYLLSNVKAPYLYDTYINENYTSLYEQYGPFKAKMIEVAVEEGNEDEADDKINSALEEIKAGKSFEEVAATYSDDVELAAETFYTKDDISDTQVLKWITDGEENLSGRIISDDGTMLYIVQLTAKTATEIHDAFAEYLKESDSFNSEVVAYYAKKNNVKLYDIDYYNYFKEDYSEYIYD